MELYETIISVYPELTELNFEKLVVLQDDSDGVGAYIREWNYSKPIPDGLKLGK
jgi:hypothetical protein